MAGLVPAIHVFYAPARKDVDARHRAGHDDFGCLNKYNKSSGRIS
jgi:hypothetical protein